MENTRCNALPKILFGLSIAIGPALAGYFIGTAIHKFKLDDRAVTVKGLVEKEVKANLGIWKIGYSVADDALSTIEQKLSQDQKAILDFLKENKVSETEISVGTVSINDAFSKEYGNNTNVKRYTGESFVMVRSPDVDLVQKLASESSSLVKAGVVLGNNNYQANPKFIYTDINQIKPELLAQALQNARKAAEQFANDSGTRVGRIRSANQGQIQILSPDALDVKQYETFEEERSIMKKIRIVSTLVFSLVD